MKTQKYLVTIEMPDGDMIGPGWIKDLLEADCDVEDVGRHKVSVIEIKEPDKSPEEELNEEIKKEIIKLPFFIRGKDQIAFARHFAKWGAEWQKAQMMKEAVEGTVMDFSSNQPRPQVDVLLDAHKYHTGDKVRIIIVKEDKR